MLVAAPEVVLADPVSGQAIARLDVALGRHVATLRRNETFIGDLQRVEVALGRANDALAC